MRTIANPLGRWDLRKKIILIMAGVLALILIGVGWFLYAQVMEQLKASLVDRGRGLVNNLASESAVRVVYEQRNEQVKSLQKLFADQEVLDYVVVLRQAKKGEVGISGRPFVTLAARFRNEERGADLARLVDLHLADPGQVLDQTSAGFLGFTAEVRSGLQLIPDEEEALPGAGGASPDSDDQDAAKEAQELGDFDEGEGAPAASDTAKKSTTAQATAGKQPGATESMVGYVCLGMSTKPLNDQIMALVRNLVLMLFSAVVLFSILIWLSSAQLYRRLQRMLEAARRTSDGDLTETLPEHGQDEMGRLADALNRINGNLNDMIRKIAVVNNSLGEAVERITASTEEVVRGAEYQVASVDETSSSVSQMLISLKGIAENVEVLASSAEESSSSILEMAATNDEVADNIHSLAASVEETTSSIEQMTSAIKEVAKSVEDLSTTAEQTSASMREMDISIGQVEQNANETATLSEEVRRDAERGADAVKKTIQGISRIAESTNTSFSVMEALGKKAQAIGQVLTVIDDVAEQTNLLALNAAIIAAQAGEHGKGFAVVADEIKDLAERTAASTSEISNLVRGVQSETKNVIETMQRGLKSVEEGVSLSSEAEQALRKILESSNKSTRMVRAIARATVEQARGSKEVTDAITRIAETVQQIASATGQQAKGSEQIMTSAERMKIITQHVHASSQEQARGSKQITKAIENISEMVHHLNRAQKEQSHGADQVMKAVERIKEVAEHHSDSMGKMKGTVDHVAEQAETLRKEVSRFKL